TLRAGLCKDLGCSEEDRTETVRRAAEVARILRDSGQVVLVALISPLRSDRDLARQIIGDGFEEVFVDADLAVCEERDPKGLYAAARQGKIANFTGIDAPYEAPVAPALHLKTSVNNVDTAIEAFSEFIKQQVSLAAAARKQS
ncbi:MAG: adenylyl-sulfate kinase, partial [Acetobacter orientalis]